MPSRKAPKGMFWRYGGLWGRAQVKGTDYKWSLRTSDPATAKRRYQQDVANLKADIYYGDGRRSLGGVLEAWGEQLVRQVAPRTATRYGVSLRRLRPFLDGMFLDELDGATVANIIRSRQAQGVSNATIRRDLVALSSVLGFAIDQGWREDNPVLARMARLKERRDPIVLPSTEDIERIIARAPGHFASLIAAAWKTGCRLDELVRAQRSQLDRARCELTIIGKGNKRRTIDLVPFDGIEVFRSIPASIKGTYLFWHHEGKPYENASSRFSALCRSVWSTDSQFRPFRFHDLRHRHAVDWLRTGLSIYDLQHRLGHTSVKTTEVYLEHLPRNQQKAVKGEAGPKAGTMKTQKAPDRA